jgi:hypothetical protein
MLYARGIKFGFQKHRTPNLLLVDLDNRCDIDCCGGIITHNTAPLLTVLCFGGESSRRSRASDNLNNETVH